MKTLTLTNWQRKQRTVNEKKCEDNDYHYISNDNSLRKH